MSTARDTGAEIRLESLTKLYPGQDRPAVDADLIIPAGETGGVRRPVRLWQDHLVEDDQPPHRAHLRADPDRWGRTSHAATHPLRRQIGYVVQGGGMMPHL
ncbi:hypothetical protein GY12_22800, partial [Micrococcus luteus]